MWPDLRTFVIYSYSANQKIYFFIHLDRILEFSIKIGDDRNTEACRLPRDRNEGVIVDYSTDNGITWQVLKVIEPSFSDIEPSTIIIRLPPGARQERTIFRFWQPLGLGGA